jgi:hypothetical protein
MLNATMGMSNLTLRTDKGVPPFSAFHKIVEALTQRVRIFVGGETTAQSNL